MPNVVTPFDRKPAKPITDTAPRHRRDGEFDDDGQWHDASDTQVAANG
jgi:hypothetical protein